MKLRSHLYVRWLFLRILSFCFLAAFASAAVQITGLFGEGGILPLKALLELVHNRLGLDAALNFPSIFWLNADDAFLQIVCWSGVGLSLLAFFGFFTGPVLAILWFLYLSIVSVGHDFMSFQWDSLLLETALPAIWFAPWGLREIHPTDSRRFQAQREPSLLFLFLLRLLCFKLMLFSGICKLASHDLTWRDLSAMTLHYETQPLPTPLAWFMHKLPVLIQKASTAAVFFVELLLPLGILWRPSRIVAAWGFIFLMLVIMLTGNYAFFNWLTIALSVTLLDDDALLLAMPRSMRMTYRRPYSRKYDLLFNTLISALPAILLGAASVSYLWLIFDQYAGTETLPAILRVPIALEQPLRSVNRYGLFAVMTTTRPEIIVEGSNDGINWLAYEFKFKPGDIHRAPPLVAPHQPRLDWQMWFAALGPAGESPWFDGFAKRLLEGSPSVLGLLERNPFPNKPPQQIRALKYDYHFSDFEGLLKRGEWWQRKPLTLFYPPTRLEDLQSSFGNLE